MTAHSNSACEKHSNEIKNLDIEIKVQPDDLIMHNINYSVTQLIFPHQKSRIVYNS